jgi:kumamolisin
MLSPKAIPNSVLKQRTEWNKRIDFTILTKKSYESHDRVINYFKARSDKDARLSPVHELEILHESSDVFSIHISGLVKDIEKVFQTELHEHNKDESSYTSNTTPLIFPTEIIDDIENILGLNQAPLLKPYLTPFNLQGTASYFPPQELAEAYKFPTSYTGKGQTIAIIELGGGYVLQYLRDYFAKLGIRCPEIISVSVDGAQNNPGDPSGANAEVYLDIEVIGCLAPDAKIVVYFAPNTFKGFYDAILVASQDRTNKPSIISISWGAPEQYWDTYTLNSFNNLFYSIGQMNISVFAASGDYGASDGINDGRAHVDFPSSSPYVTACGGTRLTYTNYQRMSETAWKTTGGGISDFFGVPGYQAGTGINVLNANTGRKNRALPDVSANADPSTGYLISVDNKMDVIGGTSAVAPLWAALTARLNQSLGRSVGFFNYLLYSSPNCFFDITQGQNFQGAQKGYLASKGWDACTGLGVPNGILLQQKIISVFRK